MSKWETVPAGSVAAQRRDVVTLERGVEYRTMGVRWYGKGAYDRGSGNTETIKAKRLFRAHAGDFVFNRIDTQNGAFDVVPAALDGALATNEFPLYVPDPRQLRADFLLLYFQQASVLREIDAMRAGSEGRSRWKEADFEEWSVPLPSLVEQRRVVDVMAAVDAQIEALGGEVARNGWAYRALLADLSETVERRPIEGVVVAAFAGGTPPRDRPDYYGGDIPWLKSGEVEGDDIQATAESITAAGLLACSAKLVPVGATIVAMYGQGDTKGRAGFVGAPITTNQAVLALVPNESVVTPRFLLHSIRSQTVALRARAIGAAQPNLSKGLVIRQEIPVYGSLDEQQTFSGVADLLRTSETQLLRELTHLGALRSTLLASLLTQDVVILEAYDAVLATDPQVVS